MFNNLFPKSETGNILILFLILLLIALIIAGCMGGLGSFDLQAIGEALP
jgi:predicted small secreted protein